MNTTTINITGMTCRHCVAAATKAIEGVRGVVNVTVSLEKSNAVVTHLDEAGVIKSIIKAIEEAGYKASV